MEFESSEIVALPNATGMEKSVLSTMLQEPEDFIPQAIEEGVAPDWFYIPAHRVLWLVLLDLYKTDTPIELVTLNQILRDKGVLDNIGGSGHLSAIYTASPSAVNFTHHLEGVKDKFFRRKVLSWVQEVSTVANSEEDLTPLLAKPVEDLLEQTQKSSIITGKQAMKEWLVDFTHKLENGGGDDLIAPCGIPTLDRIRGGLDQPGLTYVGALPSMGKTAFMAQIAAFKLTQTDERVLIFSLEMTARQLMSRMLIHLCKFQDPAVIRGTVPPLKDDLYRIREKAKLLMSERLMIEETAGLSIDQIEARCKLETRKGGIGFVGVDYVQLVQAKGHDGVEQRMTAVTHGLQRIMKQHTCSVMGLSQLTMSDGQPILKYARSMEEDADLSIRLLGDEEEKKLTGIRVTKDRHGGQVGWNGNARFNKLTQTFCEEHYA